MTVFPCEIIGYSSKNQITRRMRIKMEIILEFIVDVFCEIFLDIGIDGATDSRYPKPLRYILTAIIALLFIAVIGVIFFAGVLVMEKTVIGGVALCLLAAVVLVLAFVKIRTMIRKLKRPEQK